MNILITGASTGIGEACARWFDRKGHRVIAAVRREVDAEKLRAGASGRLMTTLVDVTDNASIETARSVVDAEIGSEGLHGLVNNAGIAVAGPLEYVPIDDLRRQLEVNVVGQIAVTQAFLSMVKRARGRIVFMGSIGGVMSTPFLGPYCASKYALEAITDAMRVELRPWGIHVAIVEPGSIATPIWTKSDRDAIGLQATAGGALARDYGAALAALRNAAEEIGRAGESPDLVAAAVDHALTAPRPKTRYLVGRGIRMRALIGRYVPDRWRDRLVIRTLKLPT